MPVDERKGTAPPALLRPRGGAVAEVKPIELLFDLVYVLAVTQLTRTLLDHLTLRGAGETLVLLLAVWGAWNYTSWTTNYFDPDHLSVRLMLLALMLPSLLLSAWLPRAFGDRGIAFALAYVALNIGRTVFALLALERDHSLRGVYQRPLAWWSATGLLWLAGGLAHHDARLAIWGAAVLLEYAGVWLGFPVPGLGHSATTDYTIAGRHMAERCHLFVILALGESIVVIGANFGDLPGTAGTVAAFAVALLGTVTLWWIYFDRNAEAGQRVISAAKDPGRLGVSAYTYVHVPIVAGIIMLAAADELAIAHPHRAVTVATTAVILGGGALYLLGDLLFTRALWDRVPRSRLTAILALAALVLLALVSSTLLLLAAATLVIVAVAGWDRRPEPTGR